MGSGAPCRCRTKSMERRDHLRSRSIQTFTPSPAHRRGLLLGNEMTGSDMAKLYGWQKSAGGGQALDERNRIISFLRIVSAEIGGGEWRGPLAHYADMISMGQHLDQRYAAPVPESVTP